MTDLRICLAISTFKNDAGVIHLLDEVYRAPQQAWPFSRIFVVDSLGSGAIAKHIAAKGMRAVEYFDAPVNLGAAGNLDQRLRLAAGQGFDLLFACNADGVVPFETVRRLVAFASAQREPVGAVYPLRKYTRGNGSFDYAGLSRVPVPGLVRPPKQLDAEAWPALWSSSNGALYALEPYRRGVRPLTELWFGWEDLAYGWVLADAGYRQFIVANAPIDDSYEYQRHKAGPVSVSMTDKPAWYAYYVSRNLMLALARTKAGPAAAVAAAAKIAIEYGATVAVRGQKLRRLALLTLGVLDGARRRGGMGPVP